MGFRSWHGVVSVALAVGLGVLTNLVTDGFTWTLAAALAGLVVAQVALAVWQGGRDHRDRRAARDELLGQVRPVMPDQATAHGVVFLLTAPYSPTPLWGRTAVLDRLVSWCVARDRAAGVARVLTGPAGVGKSRLAAAVAEALPAGWAAGRLLAADGVVERIVACGEPTLVIVDDAERVPGLDVLLARAARHPDLVRLLLLTRDAADLRPVSDAGLPHLVVEPLRPIGESSDRERWFAEAVRAYAKVLRVPPPDLPVRRAGRDEDTPLLLHARALSAVLGREGGPDRSSRELAAELVVLEQRNWEADLARLPTGCDADVLAEVVVVLSLSSAGTVSEAAELLRRVPLFAHDSSHESRQVVARWALRRYPAGPDGRLDLRPHLVGERLLVDTLVRAPELFHDDASMAVLVQACGTFPDALDLLVAVLSRRPRLLAERLAALLAAGVASHDLDHALATRVEADHGSIPDLVGLSVPESFPRLGCAVAALTAASLRVVDRNGPDFAAALDALGDRLRAVGRHDEALAADEEAVAVLRGSEPDSRLATGLVHLGMDLRLVGRRRDALAALEEAVTILRAVEDRRLLVTALCHLGASLDDVGRHEDSVTRTGEAVTIARRSDDARRVAVALTAHGAALVFACRHQDAVDAYEEAVPVLREVSGHEFAVALMGLGRGLHALGRHEDALAVTEEAVTILRGEPDQADFATALSNQAVLLREVGRHNEALAVVERAVAIRGSFTTTGPHPDLVTALTSRAVSLLTLGRFRDGVAASEEAVPLWRELVAAEPRRHLPDLAAALINYGPCLWLEGRHREALAAAEEAATTLRELAASSPRRHGPDLAAALTNLGGMLLDSGRVEESLRTHRELVDVWKTCATHDPRHTRSHSAARATLARLHDQFG